MSQNKNISRYSTFARRIGLVGIAQTAVSLKALIILPILARTLGASEYGTWALILITASLLRFFIILGLDQSLLRFLASKEKRKIVQGVITVFFAVLGTGAVLSLILFLSSDFLAINFLKDESSAFLIKIASPFLILVSLNTVALGSFRIFGLIKRYSAMVLLQTFLETGLIAYLVLSGHGLVSALISLLVSGSITFGVMLYLIISYAGFAFPDFSLLRPYLKYGLPLVPAVIFEFLIASSDRYVLGFFTGAKEVGIYSAAYGIGAIVLMFSTYIMYILFPTMCRLYDEKKVDEVKYYLSYSWKYLLMLSIPSAFGLSILAGPSLIILTTSEFVSTGKFVIPLVAFSMVLYGIGIIFGSVLMLLKRTKLFPIILGVTAVVNLGLNIFFVPLYGAIGAAMTTLIAYVILASIICYKSRQYMKFDIKIGFIIKCTIASIIMTFCIFLFYPKTIITILISVGIGTIIYFSLLYSLKAFGKEELKIISNIMGLDKLYKKLQRKT